MTLQNISGVYNISNNGVTSNTDEIYWVYTQGGIIRNRSTDNDTSTTVENGAWQISFLTEHYGGVLILGLNSDTYESIFENGLPILFQDNINIIQGPVFGTFQSPNNQANINLTFNYTPGCTDPNADNYNSEATSDDGSCEFLDTDGDGIPDYLEIEGCMISGADNYNEDATDDDGNCFLNTCNNPSAINYNTICDNIYGGLYPDGICFDDGSCNFGDAPTISSPGDVERTIPYNESVWNNVINITWNVGDVEDSNASLSYVITSNDLDVDVVSTTLTDGFALSNGSILYQIREGELEQGTYTIRCTVTDTNENSNFDEVDVIINQDADVAPTIQLVTESFEEQLDYNDDTLDSFTIEWEISDDNVGQTLTWKIYDDAGEIDGATGTIQAGNDSTTISYNTPALGVGTYNYLASVDDGQGEITSNVFTVTITQQSNTDPSLSILDNNGNTYNTDSEINIGIDYDATLYPITFTPSAVASLTSQSDSLLLDYDVTYANGLSLVNQTYLNDTEISLNFYVGINTITFRVVEDWDTPSLSSEKTIQLTYNVSNDDVPIGEQPTFVSIPDDISINVHDGNPASNTYSELVTGNFIINDGNVGQEITWELYKRGDESNTLIDTDTVTSNGGNISINDVVLNQSGNELTQTTHQYFMVINDTYTTTQSEFINVTIVETNVAPTITSLTGDDVQFTEDLSYSEVGFTLTTIASDEENDTLQYKYYVSNTGSENNVISDWSSSDEIDLNLQQVFNLGVVGQAFENALDANNEIDVDFIVQVRDAYLDSAEEVTSTSIKFTKLGLAILTSPTISFDENQSITIDLSNYISNDVGDTYTSIGVSASTSYGNLFNNGNQIESTPYTLEGTQLTYTPNSGFNATDGFTWYIVDEGVTISANVFLTGEEQPDQPIWTQATLDYLEPGFSFDEGGSTIISYNFINATDEDGDTITYGFENSTNLEIIYTPGVNVYTIRPKSGSENWSGTETLSFTATDGITEPISVDFDVTVIPITDTEEDDFSFTITSGLTDTNGDGVADAAVITQGGYVDVGVSISDVDYGYSGAINYQFQIIPNSGDVTSEVVGSSTGQITSNQATIRLTSIGTSAVNTYTQLAVKKFDVTEEIDSDFLTFQTIVQDVVDVPILSLNQSEVELQEDGEVATVLVSVENNPDGFSIQWLDEYNDGNARIAISNESDSGATLNVSVVNDNITSDDMVGIMAGYSTDGGNNYITFGPVNLQVTNTIDELNDAPTFETINDITLNEFGSPTNTSQTIYVSVTDLDPNETQFIATIDVANEQTDYLSIFNWSFDNNSNRYTKTISSNDITNQNGTSTFTLTIPYSVNEVEVGNESLTFQQNLTITDSAENSNSDTFDVSILPYNNPHTISFPDEISIDEDSGISAHTIDIDDPEGVTTGYSLYIDNNLIEEATTYIDNNGIRFSGFPNIEADQIVISLVEAVNICGTFNYEIAVSDADHYVSQDFQLNIICVNDEPTLSETPSALSLSEDFGTTTLDLQLVDPDVGEAGDTGHDFDEISVSAMFVDTDGNEQTNTSGENHPKLLNYDSYEINNDTGILRLTLSSIPNLNGGANWDVSNYNKSKLRLTLTDPNDASKFSTHDIPIGVQPVNDLPVMEIPEPQNVTINQGDSTTIVIRATDVDGDTIQKFEFSEGGVGAPETWTWYDSNDGNVEFDRITLLSAGGASPSYISVTTSNQALGNYTYYVRACDEIGCGEATTFTITVDDIYTGFAVDITPETMSDIGNYVEQNQLGTHPAGITENQSFEIDVVVTIDSGVNQPDLNNFQTPVIKWGGELLSEIENSPILVFASSSTINGTSPNEIIVTHTYTINPQSDNISQDTGNITNNLSFEFSDGGNTQSDDISLTLLWLDCAGVINGENVPDVCGVCSPLSNPTNTCVDGNGNPFPMDGDTCNQIWKGVNFDCAGICDGGSQYYINTPSSINSVGLIGNPNSLNWDDTWYQSIYPFLVLFYTSLQNGYTLYEVLDAGEIDYDGVYEQFDTFQCCPADTPVVTCCVDSDDTGFCDVETYTIQDFDGILTHDIGLVNDNGLLNFCGSCPSGFIEVPDDGTAYDIFGCMNELALNYNPNANVPCNSTASGPTELSDDEHNGGECCYFLDGGLLVEDAPAFGISNSSKNIYPRGVDYRGAAGYANRGGWMHPYLVGPYLDGPFICPSNLLVEDFGFMREDAPGEYATAEECASACIYDKIIGAGIFTYSIAQPHFCIGTPREIDGVQIGNNPNKSFSYEHPDNGETIVEGLDSDDMRLLFISSISENDFIFKWFRCSSYELKIETENGLLEGFPKLFNRPTTSETDSEFYNLVKGEYVYNFQESANYKFTLTATFKDVRDNNDSIYLDPETNESKELQITQFFPTQTTRNTYVEINIIPIYQSLFDYNVLFLDNNISNLLFQGIDITPASLSLTPQAATYNDNQESWDDVDLDRRKPLGCFNYNDDNKFQDLWPFESLGEKFLQIDEYEIEEWKIPHIVDVDVRMYKRRGISNSPLFYYWDEQLYTDYYNETTAPLEVQFYFYPRPSKDEDNNEYTILQYKPENLLMEDFKNGYYYLAYIDWGDGSQIEFNTEPKKLDFNTIVKHNYEMAGIYEITGYMLRVNFDDDGNPLGVIHNTKFTTRININVEREDEFEYLGGTGYSFIPYKDTTPIIGGVSLNSLYYNSISRQLGILPGEVSSIDTYFDKYSDRLKSENALFLMDETKVGNEIVKYQEQIQLVTRGLYNKSQELGSSIGFVDLQLPRFLDRPKQIWQMLGFNDYSSYDGHILGFGDGEGIETPLQSETDCTDPIACNFGEYNASCTYASDFSDGITITFREPTVEQEFYPNFDYNTGELGDITTQFRCNTADNQECIAIYTPSRVIDLIDNIPAMEGEFNSQNLTIKLLNPDSNHGYPPANEWFDMCPDAAYCSFWVGSPKSHKNIFHHYPTYYGNIIDHEAGNISTWQVGGGSTFGDPDVQAAYDNHFKYEILHEHVGGSLSEMRPGYTYQIIIAGDTPGYNSDRSWILDFNDQFEGPPFIQTYHGVGNLLTFPVAESCSDESLDMYQYSLNTTPSGDYCWLNSECQQYGDEQIYIEELDAEATVSFTNRCYYDVPYFSGDSYYANSTRYYTELGLSQPICATICGSISYQVPCFDDSECDIYDAPPKLDYFCYDDPAQDGVDQYGLPPGPFCAACENITPYPEFDEYCSSSRSPQECAGKNSAMNPAEGAPIEWPDFENGTDLDGDGVIGDYPNDIPPGDIPDEFNPCKWLTNIEENNENGICPSGTTCDEETKICMSGGRSNSDDSIVPHPGNPSSPTYWKNIIPENYDIYNDRSDLDWNDGYYYPTLPTTAQDGSFTNYTGTKIVFGTIGRNWNEDDELAPVTNEEYQIDSLIFSYTSEYMDKGVLEDVSGYDNVGMCMNDYRMEYDEKTIEPIKKNRKFKLNRGKQDKAF